MMVLADQSVDILGITTVNGNVDVEQVTTNVGVVLDQMGASVPIYKGCAGPLVSEVLDSGHIHGEDGLGGIRHRLPQTLNKPEAEHAALALIRFAREHKGKLTILALGPLTNLALAARLDPEFVKNISSLVIMGGAVEGRGNASPSAEFNILADPEAAAIVFEVGFPEFWLLSWETTLKHPITWNRYDELKNLQTERAGFFSDITAELARMLRLDIGAPGLLIPDPLAAAVVLKPESVTKMDHVPVRVEISGKYGRGLTSVDWSRQSGNQPNIKIVLSMDENIIHDLIRNAFI
jgi:purine nucleosidase